MRLHLVFLSLIITCQVVVFSSVANAKDPGEYDYNDIKEKWGQVMLCQRIYTLPGVTPRLYDFDTEQCELADEFMLTMVSRFPEGEQSRLKSLAERHARALGFNAAEPYHSVPACREFCSSLAKLQKQQDHHE